MAVSLGELAVRFGCELRGDPDIAVERVATLGAAATRRARVFSPIRTTARSLPHTRAAAVVLHAMRRQDCPTAMLVSENPYATYARIAALLHPAAAARAGRACHGASSMPVRASIRAPQVAAFAVIGAGRAHRRARLRRSRTVSSRLTYGSPPTCDWSRASRLGAGVRIGARTLVQPGAVIGADGFGFAPRARRLAQGAAGRQRCSIGEDVEIGANTTIDRGAIEDTVIEEGVKLDNLIMIGAQRAHRRAYRDRRLHRRFRQHPHRRALHDRRRTCGFAGHISICR